MRTHSKPQSTISSGAETITKLLEKVPSGEKIRNTIFSFFAVPPSHNYIFDDFKQLFFYNISSLNGSFRHVSKLGYYPEKHIPDKKRGGGGRG